MDVSYNGHVISFVGAGGKTSLMYALAGYFTKKGAQAIATTTTHIYRPGGYLWAKDREDVQRLWARGSYAVVGQPCGDGKIKSLPGMNQ